MSEIKLPYGKSSLEFSLDEDFKTLNVSETSPEYSLEEEIRRALDNPLGKGLKDFKNIKNVAITTSDKTRPVPNEKILPILLDEINKIGVADEHISIIIGTGLHAVADEKELEETVGQEIFSRVEVISHDAWDQENLINLGTSKENSPIDTNKRFYEADLKISLGVIDPHQFAGFSGGAKGASIGLGGERLVFNNHSLLTKEGARLGNIINNPLREDIEEIGEKIGLDFILNVVLNSNKEVLRAVSGSPREAHREGVKWAQKFLQVEIKEEADLVIAASGGFPKDINLYQAQKALLHSAEAVKEGGTIILVAECLEGVGSDLFIETMQKGNTAEEILLEFKKSPFKVGAHKAYLWCNSLIKARVFLISKGIDEEMSQIMQVEKEASIEKALEKILPELRENPKIYIMPKASSTIPILKK